MKANLELTLTKKEQTSFARHIQKEIILQMEERIIKNSGNIYNLIWQHIDDAINNSPEAYALISGKLRYDLGLKEDEAERTIQQIIQILKKSVNISVEKNKNFVKVLVKLLKSKTDYTEILSIPEAKYYSNNKKGVKHLIPWLDWLLFRGHDQVVEEYRVKYVPPGNLQSRSGGAFMVEGGSYNIIPSQYTGTEKDNFITRALSKLNEETIKILEKIIT